MVPIEQWDSERVYCCPVVLYEDFRIEQGDSSTLFCYPVVLYEDWDQDVLLFHRSLRRLGPRRAVRTVVERLIQDVRP